jgi:hypothetical protein
MAAKFTFFMHQQEYGWSESWYSPVNYTYTQATAAMTTYCLKRSRMLGTGCFIDFARYSQDQTFANQGFRQSFVIQANGVSGPIPGTVGTPGDAAFTAALCMVNDAAFLHAKPWYIRGIDDASVQNEGELIPTVAFSNAFAILTAFILLQGWGWKGNVQPLHNPVIAINQNASGQVDISVGPQPVTLLLPFTPFPVGYRLSIRLFGLTGAGNLNTTLTVKVTGPGTCTTERRMPFFPWTGSGTMTSNQKTVYPAFAFNLTRAVERRAGRPSYLSRGRRKGRPVG